MDHKAYMYVVECVMVPTIQAITTDMKKRITVHNSGKGAKYTRARLPVKLIFAEGFDSKEEAMSAEALFNAQDTYAKEHYLKENQNKNLVDTFDM